jgi:hypothetical protein
MEVLSMFDKLIRKARRLIGLKNRYAVREIKNDKGKLRGAVLVGEGEALSIKEKKERFRAWQAEQG